MTSLASAQGADPALKNLFQWVTRAAPPSTHELQGLKRATWHLVKEFQSLKIINGVLCREFFHKRRPSYFQQLIPASLVTQVLNSIHSSTTGGHLGIFKTVEKVRERFYCPGFQDDVKLFINRCEQCQKRANPHKTHRHSLVKWTPSYLFHHIGIDFMGPLPLSDGNQHILLIGDHFSKWYEAIPLPDQTASTTVTALLEKWIFRFGCPHSIHSDQGRIFESKLFKGLNQALQVHKTRTTAFRPQSNAVVERMNRTLQSMLAKCINDEQSNWSQQLPYVMIAYRTSVHESTGYTPPFLVYGQEVCLPIDLMYPNTSDQPPADVHEFVSARQVRFQKTYNSARTALNFNQRRRNAICNRKVHGPTYKVDQKVLLHIPVVPVGKSPKFFSPWKGPYVILQCPNDVIYRIQEIATQKELVVQYDRLKIFHESPPTSNVPTRDERNPKKIPHRKTQRQEPSIPEYDHDQCTWHYPYHTIPSATTCSRGAACTTPPATPAPTTTPVGSPKPVLPSPSSSYSGATAPYSLGSPGTPKTTTSFRSSTPTPEPLTSPAESPAHSRSLPSSPSTPSSVRSKPWFREVIDNASRNLQFGEAAVASPVPPQRNPRSITREQRKAQPLWTAKLPPDLSEFNSPASVKKKKKSSPTL